MQVHLDDNRLVVGVGESGGESNGMRFHSLVGSMEGIGRIDDGGGIGAGAALGFRAGLVDRRQSLGYPHQYHLESLK